MFRVKNKIIPVTSHEKFKLVQHEYPVSVILGNFKDNVLFKCILNGDCNVWTHIQLVALTTGYLGVTKSIVVKLI